MSKILVCIPAFNEAEHIGEVVRLCKCYSDDVIVFDDGSQDKTAVEAMLAKAEVITHDVNKGYGATIQAILNVARDRRFQSLVILDGDGQHSAGDIRNVAMPILEQGYDMVIGHRNHSQIPFYRRMGQKVLSSATGVLAEKNVDSQSGFRAYSPKAVAELRPKETGMAISSELVSLATKAGLKITEVPISVKYEGNSPTHNPVVQGVDTLMRIIRMISERKPLLFFGLGGFIITLCGVGLGVKSIFMLIEHAGALPIGTALVALLLMVNGTFSMFTGVILNVIKKMKA